VLKILVFTKQTKRTKQHDTSAIKQRRYHINRKLKNGRNCIKPPQTTPGKPQMNMAGRRAIIEMKKQEIRHSFNRK